MSAIVLGAAHRIGYKRDSFFQPCKYLVPLRFIVLDEISAHPEIVSSLCKGLRPQSELGLDDGADNEASINYRTLQDAPQVGNIRGRPVVEPEVFRRHPEIVHLGVLDIAHALVVANGQGQEGCQHCTAVDDVTVKQIVGVGDLHDLLLLVDFVDQGVDTTREIIRCGH